MPGVSADITFTLDASLTGTNDLGSPRQRVPISKSVAFTAGTDSVAKANLMFSDTRTLAASANEDLDLAGVLADALGSVIAAAEIVAIYIEAASGNTNDVRVGPAVSGGFTGPFVDATDRIAIKPAEWQPFVSRAGWPVTATTADKINIANSGAGTAVTYNIVVIGRTVAA